MQNILIDYKVIDLINHLKESITDITEETIEKIGMIYDDIEEINLPYQDLNQIRCIYIKTDKNEYRYLTETRVLQKAIFVDNENIFINVNVLNEDFYLTL